MFSSSSKFIKFFNQVDIDDVKYVGGKNASLGEMYCNLSKNGVRVPYGFATTAYAYNYFLKRAGIKRDIQDILKGLNTHNINDLAKRGLKVRQTILKAEFPEDLKADIITAYQKMEKMYGNDFAVAVRSSATAEDLPDASFAGQQETYLNIRGEYDLLDACKKCIASLFTNRAISYRVDKKFDHFNIALSIGVQKMVRSDVGSSGVMFTIDTESGFRDAVLINSTYGLGEYIVQGRVTPDEHYVFKKTNTIISRTIGSKKEKLVYAVGGNKPVKNVKVSIADRQKLVLSDKEVLELAKWGKMIEKHYKKPMDIEWAKDGKDGKLYIVQARPETVQSQKDPNTLEEYILEKEKISAKGGSASGGKSKKLKVLAEGRSVGAKIGAGKVNIIKDVEEISKFQDGSVLVTEMTDPDWEPIMKKAAAIVTNSGGRTCFTEDTIILTNKGFLTIKDIFKRYKKEIIKVVSLNKENLKVEWKKVIDSMVRESMPVQVSISQTGRVKNNTLGITPDHKILTFHNRKLISKEIQKVIDKKEYLVTPVKIPSLKNNKHLSNSLAYLLGGILTDGHIYLTETHGEVQFIQKPTKEKQVFIEKMKKCLKENFNYDFKTFVKKESCGIIRGKEVKGNANAYRCYSKSIAQKMKDYENTIVNMVLSERDEFLYNFLAGVIDGDGTYNNKNNRINIFCSEKNLENALVICCLKLGINFQITENRNIANIQIVDKVEEIFNYTMRVKGKYNREKFGIKLFSAKQLLEDIIDKVNYKGRIKPYIKNNLLIDANKIKNNLIPMIKGQLQNHELTDIVESDLKMLRVNLSAKMAKQNVYNITVEDNHNYAVFTKKMTPILVNNCHAAIVSRELGIPCLVGTVNGTESVKKNQEVTVSCAEGEAGYVYKGIVPFSIKKTNLKKLKKPKVKIMMNVGAPDQAFTASFIPNEGVGLAREEFIINNYIKIHPLALIELDKKKPAVKINGAEKKKIEELTIGYKNKKDFYVDKLAEGVARICAAFYPKDVIVRFSDFKSDEYANLIGGKYFEPVEDNPMIGWRGASRYYDKKFKPAFELECMAMKKVRDEMKLTNLKLMIPFCRTIDEGLKVLEILAANKLYGKSYIAYLKKNKNKIPQSFTSNPELVGKPSFLTKKIKVKNVPVIDVYVMCEVPSDVILADEFAKIFDGFSIGSNDLTQLTLGVDRNSQIVSHVYDERNEAVKKFIKEVIATCKKCKTKIGICGQAPSDFPDFAKFLIEQKIDSISLTPDTVLKLRMELGKKRK